MTPDAEPRRELEPRTDIGGSRRRDAAATALVEGGLRRGPAGAPPARLTLSLGALWHELPARLRRVTTSGRFIPEIDGLRFLAIAPVVLLHLGTNLKRTQAVVYSPPADQDPIGVLASHGGVGVAIFFAISGFILAIPFAAAFMKGAEPVRLRTFYLRRLTRLEPPYLVTLIAFYLLRVATQQNDALELLPHLGASALYIHNLVYGAWSTVNPVAWSLEIEVQFYLMAPLLCRVFLIESVLVRRAVLVVGAAGCFAMGQWVPLAALNLDKSLLSHGQYFVPGLLFADLFVSGAGAAARRDSVLWDLVGLGALAFLALVGDDFTLAAGTPVASLILFFVAFRSRLLARALKHPWTSAIGGMCYTIYLIHYPLIAAIMMLTARVSATTLFSVNYLIQAILVLPGVLAVSAVVFLLLEKPCMRRDWPQRFAARVLAWR